MWTVPAKDAQIPALGFGTFTLSPDDCQRMVTAALEVGYRHVDTAQVYDNEDAVGAAMAQSPVPREDVWLTTKVWVDKFRDGDLQKSVDDSLKRLQTDYVDLLLLHWPNPDVPLEETLKALASVKRDGRARHIGLSNFTVALMKQAFAVTEEPLAVNQVEYHPYLNQDPVLDMVRAKGMALTAYSPVAQGNILGDETLKRIGDKYGKNEAQVTLRWLIQQDGVIAIPRTKSEEHCKTNLEVFDFDLTEEEMAEIKALHRPDGRQISPEGLAPEWDT
ncbi:oxidoreductase, aldo/keto reductase family [Caenispirillum salinarum AK4]|uniref:Oxidoreductase, aldo/keto reductase family n=1 Tax=Caenispirillum salinarum AK4 TaxID=1238182 RepID=K9H741_9PROT|nr:aldo/keto reductase [Caenispirillum salinarum]EKV32894.1 oxidoreductase, aldo/keto reductase family [Caenispirillum salinarum AK4]